MMTREEIVRSIVGGSGPAAGRNGGTLECTCRRSQCLKKYCDCVRASRPCSAACKCKDCKNPFQRGHGKMRPSTSALSLQFSSGGGSATKLRPDAPLVDDKQSPRTVVVGHPGTAPHRAPHTHTPRRTYRPAPAGPSTISPPLLQKRSLHQDFVRGTSPALPLHHDHPPPPAGERTFLQPAARTKKRPRPAPGPPAGGPAAHGRWPHRGPPGGLPSPRAAGGPAYRADAAGVRPGAPTHAAAPREGAERRGGLLPSPARPSGGGTEPYAGRPVGSPAPRRSPPGAPPSARDRSWVSEGTGVLYKFGSGKQYCGILKNMEGQWAFQNLGKTQWLIPLADLWGDVDRGSLMPLSAVHLQTDGGSIQSA